MRLLVKSIVISDIKFYAHGICLILRSGRYNNELVLGVLDRYYCYCSKRRCKNKYCLKRNKVKNDRSQCRKVTKEINAK